MTRRRYWVYFLLFLMNGISYTDRVNMSLAGHSIATEFHLTSVALGYLFSSFLWAYVLMMLPGGRMIDGLGAHRVATICATIWSVAQIFTGMAGSFWTMLVARLGLGIGRSVGGRLGRGRRAATRIGEQCLNRLSQRPIEFELRPVGVADGAVVIDVSLIQSIDGGHHFEGPND